MEQTGPDPTLQSALRSLHDLAVPVPVSRLPQTLGWALIAALLAAICFVAAFRWIKRYRANAYRREALIMLDDIQRLLLEPSTRPDAVYQLAELLKRTALASWPRKEVASLSSRSWANFLRDHGGDVDSSELARMLDDAEYRRPDDFGGTRFGDEVVVAARAWIERHHVSA